MHTGHVKFTPPKDPRLKKYIKGYYVHTCSEADFNFKLTFYQNITTCISIYQSSVTSSEGRLRRQTYTKDAGYSSVLVGLVDKYQEVEFFGPLNRLAIVFHPGGINQFIRVPLSTLLQKHFSLFHYFDEAFATFLPLVYGTPSLEKKREYLDEFFLNQFQLLDEPELLKAIDVLVGEDEIAKVDVLAKQLGISRRSLLRKFKKHLGYSVEEYISVIKFRRALLNFQKQREDYNLSSIAYSSNYYDQPDFNRNLKSRSGMTPKELFAQLEIVDDTLFWKL